MRYTLYHKSLPDRSSDNDWWTAGDLKHLFLFFKDISTMVISINKNVLKWNLIIL